MPASPSHFLHILTALGGIALFLLGMEVMTDGVQRLAGFQLRSVLGRLTKNPALGVAGGTTAGMMVNSGPASMIILAFVNAGVLSLYQSISLIFGANIGTTLSLQIVAFGIGQYSYGLLAVAVAMRLCKNSWIIHNLGSVFIGISLLFLGLHTMKGAASGLQDMESLKAALALLDGTTVRGMATGLLLGTFMTVLLQSSGATISFLFSLAAVGMIDNVGDAIPFVLGAHVGTCTPVVLVAMRGTRNAKRVAAVHVLFNVVGGVFAFAMIRFYEYVVPMTSDNLVRQIANFNTGTQLINTLLFLPFLALTEKALLRMIPKRADELGKSFLDPDLIPTPEMAILSTIRELQRLGSIVESMFKRTMDGLVSLDRKKFSMVAEQENSVDMIKDDIETFINKVGERSLSPRQGMLLQQLALAAHAMERIGDYIEALGIITVHKIDNRIWFDNASMEDLLDLSGHISRMLKLTLGSIDPMDPNFRDLAKRVIEERKAYRVRVKQVRNVMNERMLADGHEASRSLFFARYLAVFDKIVDHLREIARQERKESYQVKSYKLERVEPLARDAPPRPTGHELPESYEEAMEQLEAAQRSRVRPPEVDS